jgi:hypothetical protein
MWRVLKRRKDRHGNRTRAPSSVFSAAYISPCFRDGYERPFCCDSVLSSVFGYSSHTLTHSHSLAHSLSQFLTLSLSFSIMYTVPLFYSHQLSPTTYSTTAVAVARFTATRALHKRRLFPSTDTQSRCGCVISAWLNFTTMRFNSVIRISPPRRRSDGKNERRFMFVQNNNNNNNNNNSTHSHAPAQSHKTRHTINHHATIRTSRTPHDKFAQLLYYD